MKWLRTTIWKPDLTTVSVVVRAADVTVPLEEISRDTGQEMLSIDDIFELESEDVAYGTMVAGRRALIEKDTERNMAILYYWLVGHMALVKDGGVLGTSKPAPLSTDAVRLVFRQLMEHPHYKGFTLQATSNDGTQISMKDGHATS